MALTKMMISALAAALCLQTVEGHRVTNQMSSSLVQSEHDQIAVDDVNVEEDGGGDQSNLDDAMDKTKEAAKEAAAEAAETTAGALDFVAQDGVDAIEDFTGLNFDDEQKWFIELDIGWKIAVTVGILLALLLLIFCVFKWFKGCLVCIIIIAAIIFIVWAVLAFI